MFLTVMFMEPFWNHLLSLRNRRPDRPHSKLFAAHCRTESRRVGPSGVVRRRPPLHAGRRPRQLQAYFAGQLREFELPLDMQGTDFQKRVWGQVAAIPYGETRSYLRISTALGSPGAVRAVGAADGANPVPIVVPCHRVIGAHGKLVG